MSEFNGGPLKKTTMLVAATVLGAQVLAAAPVKTPTAVSIKTLEACYDTWGEIHEEQRGKVKVSKFKSEEELWLDCNKNVLAQVKAAPTVKEALEIAGVIGRKTNWGAAAIAYEAIAKKDKTRAVCVDKDVLYSLDNALARPGDDELAQDGKALMATCWPTIQASLVDWLGSADLNGYVKDNVCAFLKSKNGLPDNKKSACP